jgi:hypothetical protein
VGPGKPHREGLLSLDALESRETLRKVAVVDLQLPFGDRGATAAGG